jgi:hypothetical protein
MDSGNALNDVHGPMPDSSGVNQGSNFIINEMVKAYDDCQFIFK